MIGRRLLEVAESLKPDLRPSTDADAAAPVNATDDLDAARADPARTTNFTVTSVRVVGPLWGLQSRTYGYDMRPDTKLTPSQLRTFFTPWHYARVRMAWEGRWVSIQAVAS
jgi:hypothetical protein